MSVCVCVSVCVCMFFFQYIKLFLISFGCAFSCCALSKSHKSPHDIHLPGRNHQTPTAPLAILSTPHMYVYICVCTYTWAYDICNVHMYVCFDRLLIHLGTPQLAICLLACQSQATPPRLPRASTLFNQSPALAVGVLYVQLVK